MNKLILRNYQDKDANSVATIISKTWNYEDFTNKKVAKRMSKVFLYSCLNNQTYTQVALLNDQLIGIIMGKNNMRYKRNLYYAFKQWYNILLLMSTKEGRYISKSFARINKIDQELLSDIKYKYDGELAFFAVDEKARGLGVGKKLLNKFFEYCTNTNLESFYLFTDTSCNFGFYESQGLKRVNEVQNTFEIENNKIDMSFYLYEYTNK